MHKACKYKILPELKLIIDYYAGPIDSKCVLEVKNRMMNDPLFDQSFNVLDDFRDAVMNYSLEGTREIIEWIAKNHNYPRQSAHLTTSPDQVVGTTVFDKLSSVKLVINLKIFSTIEPAVKWIDLDEDKIPIIEAAIEKLRSE